LPHPTDVQVWSTSAVVIGVGLTVVVFAAPVVETPELMESIGLVIAPPPELPLLPPPAPVGRPAPPEIENVVVPGRARSLDIVEGRASRSSDADP
jgi:hypothetical protein